MKASCLLEPLPDCELAIAHVHQLPVFCTKHALVIASPAPIYYACSKTCCHEVIVSCMRIAEHGVLHQPCDAPSQTPYLCALPATPNEYVLDALSKFQHGSFRWVRLREIVRVLEHLSPMIAVKVVYRAACTNQKVPLLTEL